MTAHDAKEQHFKWGVSFGQNYDAAHLDDRRHWSRQGIDPDEHIAAMRAAGDREAERRGLVFTGEVRLGDEIQRQYFAPSQLSRWQRIRLRLLGGHNEKPLSNGQR